jgi:hypothetical protein
MRVTSTVPGYVALTDVSGHLRETAWTDEARRILAVEARARELLDRTEASFRADGLLSDDLDDVLLCWSG